MSAVGGARTSEAILAAAKRAFTVGFLMGLRFNEAADESPDDQARAEAEFKRWWNAAAGFEEVT